MKKASTPKREEAVLQGAPKRRLAAPSSEAILDAVEDLCSTLREDLENDANDESAHALAKDMWNALVEAVPDVLRELYSKPKENMAEEARELLRKEGRLDGVDENNPDALIDAYLFPRNVSPVRRYAFVLANATVFIRHADASAIKEKRSLGTERRAFVPHIRRCFKDEGFFKQEDCSDEQVLEHVELFLSRPTKGHARASPKWERMFELASAIGVKGSDGLQFTDAESFRQAFNRAWREERERRRTGKGEIVPMMTIELGYDPEEL